MMFLKITFIGLGIWGGGRAVFPLPYDSTETLCSQYQFPDFTKADRNLQKKYFPLWSQEFQTSHVMQINCNQIPTYLELMRLTAEISRISLFQT